MARPGPGSGNPLGPHLVSSCGRGLLASVGVVEIGKYYICDHQHALPVRNKYQDKKIVYKHLEAGWQKLREILSPNIRYFVAIYIKIFRDSRTFGRL